MSESEIERLREENANLRRWKALDKPLTAAMAVVNAEIQTLRDHNADLRAALEIVKAERDHWHSLVSRADRVQFPFEIPKADKPSNWEQSAPDEYGNRETIREAKR